MLFSASARSTLRRALPKDFEKGLIGFGKDIEKNLLSATSPFVFSTVNERSILRFLKLIDYDNGKIGTYAKLVDDRNETTHPNGNIFFSTQAALDAKITEILRVVDEIQAHSKPVIERAYREFLLQNHDPEEREYPTPPTRSARCLSTRTTCRSRTSTSAATSTLPVCGSARDRQHPHAA